MKRAFGVTMVALAALVVMQFVAIRNMRLEISRLRAAASAVALETREDEIVRTGAWLHAWLESESARRGGLCPSGSPDIGTISRLLFGTYLKARAEGVPEADARQRIIESVQ